MEADTGGVITCKPHEAHVGMKKEAQEFLA